MHLVMFDIDGTLTASNHIHIACYLKTVRDLYNLDGRGFDWTTFRNMTDTGITSEIFETHLGRTACDKDYESVLEVFMRHLESYFKERPEEFSQVPGAVNLFEILKERENTAVAIATGGWLTSALYKLEKAGFDVDSVPMASSNDALTREKIMETARERAREYYGVRDFDSVTYAGDGMWDVTASENLGYDFIGVGDNSPVWERFSVKKRVMDYLAPEKFLSLLN